MTSHQKIETVNSQWDVVKWCLIGLFMIAVVAANYFWAIQSTILRIGGNLAAILFLLCFASFTIKGKKFWLFLRQARIELRKVIWPTRQETVQATLLIVIVVIIAALFLWGIDSVLLWAVSIFTGQRGS